MKTSLSPEETLLNFIEHEVVWSRGIHRPWRETAFISAELLRNLVLLAAVAPKEHFEAFLETKTENP